MLKENPSLHGDWLPSRRARDGGGVCVPPGQRWDWGSGTGREESCKRGPGPWPEKPPWVGAACVRL